MNYRPIKDGAIVYSGYAFKRQDLKPIGDIPVIKIGNLVGKMVDYTKTDYFSYDTMNEKFKKYFLDDKDVLIAMTGQGSVGRVAQLRKKQSNDILLLNQRVGKFICNPQNLDNDYLFYVLSSKYYQEILFNLGYGSGQPNLSPDTILNILIPFPDIITQKHIASLLSFFDDKIELNAAINENLEQHTQEIFRKMFPDCMMNGVAMKQVIDVRDGTHDSPKSQKTGHYLITSKHLLPYSVNKNEANLISDVDYVQINERSKVEYGDILISMIGTVGLISFVSDSDVDFAIKNVGLFRTSQNAALRFYILNYLKSLEVTNYIEQHLAGSTQKYISLTELRNLPIFVPADNELNRFNSLVTPMYNKIISIYQENQRLGALRDTLLPKLMNGEIDVSNL